MCQYLHINPLEIINEMKKQSHVLLIMHNLMQFKKSHQEVGAKEGGQKKPELSTMDMLAGRPTPKFYEAVTVTE